MNSTPSHFSFLQPDWPELLAEARRAEAAALTDPRTACFYARRTLELAVAWLFKAESGRGGCLNMPYKADLSAFLFEPSFQQLVGPAVHAKMDVLRRLGNHAVHQARAVPVQDAQNALSELTEHGAMPAARLYASPFTGIHAHGPEGVFDAAKVEHLFKALEGLELQQAAA